MSRAPQAKGPGRSRPAAAGIRGAGRSGDLKARLGGAGEALRLAIGAGQDQKRWDLPFRAASNRRREAARL